MQKRLWTERGTVDVSANKRWAEQQEKKDNVLFRYSNKNTNISVGSILLYDQSAQKKEKQVFMPNTDSSLSLTQIAQYHVF